MILKRTFDLSLALVLLVVLGPFFLLVTLAVVVESGWPALFRQTRVGRDFRPFVLLKFRTMRLSGGADITVDGDARITRVGAILRRYKVDEIPQLINIVRGEMSFVGPRPELPQYVALMPGAFVPILSVRPGITDEASLKYRDESVVLAAQADPKAFYIDHVLPDKIAVSARYIEQRSFWHDMAIIGRTMWAAIHRTA